MAFIFTIFFTILSCSYVSSSETVQIETVEKPATCEKAAKNGDMISMRYKGNLFNPDTKEVGKQFDSNYERTDTFDFQLGAGQVIQGWEQGIPGMCVGETRKLVIPPSLAYGDRGFSDLIPPKSTLVFEIQLKDIGDGASDKKLHGHENGEHDHEQDSFSAIDTNKDKQITSEEMAAYIRKFNDEGGEDKFENIDTIVGEIFQEDDKNKDGVISIDEYQQFEEPDEEEVDEADPTAYDGEEPPSDEEEEDEEDDEYDEEGAREEL